MSAIACSCNERGGAHFLAVSRGDTLTLRDPFREDLKDQESYSSKGIYSKGVIAEKKFQEADVLAMAFHPDNETLVTGHKDGSLRVWDLPKKGNSRTRDAEIPDIPLLRQFQLGEVWAQENLAEMSVVGLAFGRVFQEQSVSDASAYRASARASPAETASSVEYESSVVMEESDADEPVEGHDGEVKVEDSSQGAEAGGLAAADAEEPVEAVVDDGKSRHTPSDESTAEARKSLRHQMQGARQGIMKRVNKVSEVASERIGKVSEVASERAGGAVAHLQKGVKVFEPLTDVGGQGVKLEVQVIERLQQPPLSPETRRHVRSEAEKRKKKKEKEEEKKKEERELAKVFHKDEGVGEDEDEDEEGTDFTPDDKRAAGFGPHQTTMCMHVRASTRQLG